MRRLTLTLLLLLLAAPAVAQQVNDIRDLVPRSMEYGGSTELLTEGYAVNGRDPRRPSGSARFMLRPFVRFGEGFEISANVLLSTEQQSLDGASRQNINRLGIRPAWSWGSLALGDFSYAYTPHTYQGINVRGGALELHPGLLRLSVLGGVTQKAIAGDASNGSYGRQLYAGRLGIGREDGSFFDLLALYANDDAGSISADEIYDDTDSNLVGTIAPTSVTPQENLVLGAATQINAFDRHLTWHGELTGAAYTRDTRASEIDEGELRDVPNWLTSVFTPRNGSNLDYAWSTDLRLRLPGWDLMGEYEYVGPGYRSLGVGSLLVDRSALGGRVAYQARRFSATLNGTRQRDNVLGQKLDTTARDALGGNLNVRLRRNLLAMFQSNFSLMQRNTEDPDQRINYVNQVWGAGARLSLQKRWVRSVGLDYRLQDAQDSNPVRSASNFTSHQVVVPVGFQLSETLQLTPQLGAVWIHSDADGWVTTHTEKVALRHSGMQRRWVTTFSAGTSFDTGSRRLVLSLLSDFRVSANTSLKVVVRNNMFRNRGGGSADEWEEVIGRVSLENRW